MGHQDGKQARIAVLIAVAMTAIALAVLEVLAGEIETAGATPPPWASHLRRVDEALQRNHVGVAARAWHDAYVAALGSRRWEGMVAVGDAALRVGEVGGSRLAAGAQARQAYLGALFRAREDWALDGLLHVATAFAALGDTAMAIHCLRLAERMAMSDAVNAHRIRTHKARLGQPSLAQREASIAGP
jgi:hypothetical protein